MFDADSVFEQVLEQHQEFEDSKKEPVYPRIWDGDWNLFEEADVFYEASFSFENMDAGTATLKLPLDHIVSRKMMNPEDWPTKSMYLTFDKDGARWSGRIETARVQQDRKGESHLELLATHDYKKLKELLVWANPFLPAETQFPKAWVLFGPSRWAVATTLFVNLLRKGNSLWMLPDDPLDIGQWFDLDMSGWSMAVKPVNFFEDNSLTATVTSRFKYFHDCVRDICLDAQLTIEARRYLPGDENPIPGSNLRHGCLVFEVVDKSGWNKSTALFGDLINGLTRGIRRVIGTDGLAEGYDYIQRVEHPAEYYQRGFLGTAPTAPWVVLEHGEHSGIEVSDYEYIPPGPSQFVTGGSSMAGVNEVIKSGIVGLGGFLGSFFGQSQAGTVVAELLEPLYSDVFFAFKAEKDTDRLREQGWDAPFEHWVEGSDKAYSLSGLTSMRKAKYDTRERHSVSVEMANGAPYWVGPQGFGDFFIGDRVAVHALGMPEDKLFVEQVESLEYTASDSEEGWEIGIGKPEFDSGLNYVSRKLEQTREGVHELGVW